MIDNSADTLPTPLTYTQNTGTNVQLPPTAQPIDYFSIFADDDILGHITDETNQ